MDWVIVALISVWVALAGFLLTTWHLINGGGRKWRVSALLLVLGFALVHQLVFNTLTEDAFVTFRYAENVVNGTGPVFNPGEQVEGYSDFSWMVLLAFGETLFGVGVDTGAVILGTLCTLGAVVLAYLLVSRVVRDARPDSGNAAGMGVLAAALTAGTSGLAALGMSGLPTSLFLVLVLGVCYALAAQHPVIAGVLVAVAMMTRPDGLLVAFVALGWLTFNAARGRTDWWSPGAFTIGALVLLVPWTAWRLTYYGALVPTVLAAGGPGDDPATHWRRLSGFLLAHHAVLLLVIAVVAVLALRRRGEIVTRRARGVVWLALALTVLYVAALPFTATTMPIWRLLAPVPPLLAVAACAAYGVAGTPDTDTARSGIVRSGTLSTTRLVAPTAVMALCGVSVAVSLLHPAMLPATRDTRQMLAEAGEIGSWLQRTLPAGTVISSFGNGALAYHAGTSLIIAGTLTKHRGNPPDDTQVALVSETRGPALVAATTGGYTAEQHCGIAPAYAEAYQAATFRKAGSSKWVTMYAVAPRARQLISRLDADPGFEYVPCEA